MAAAPSNPARAALVTVVAQRMPDRPLTRGDCVDGCRPCPWYSCRYHLGLDVDSRGRLYVHVDPDDLDESVATCALDAADRGPHTLEQVGTVIGRTRERARQIELRARQRIARRVPHLVELLERDAEADTDTDSLFAPYL